MHQVEWRRCQFCKQSAQVYDGGVYNLVKYGIRHYAHPRCLATSRGREGGKALIPEHEHNSYNAGLADADDTTRALADHVDTVTAKRALRLARARHSITVESKPGRAPAVVCSRWSCSCGAAGDDWTTAERANAEADEHYQGVKP